MRSKNVANPVYTIVGSNGSAESFNAASRLLADRFMSVLDRFSISLIVSHYKEFQSKAHLSAKNAKDLALEILTIGVLWSVYGRYTEKKLGLISYVLTACAKLRKGKFKKVADLCRALLLPSLVEKQSLHLPLLSVDSLGNLANFLAATGEFDQETEIINQWQHFLLRCNPSNCYRYLQSIEKLTAWFLQQAQELLGTYTKGVETFRKQAERSHKHREDYIARNRKEIEYHLNMLGAILMNRSFKDKFNKCKEKIVLAPGCMRQIDKPCQARQTEKGLTCVGCSSQCNVNKLRKACEEKGVGVLLMLHSSGVFKTGSNSPTFGKDTGIVGIACALNLLSGGWQAESMGIPAQCVVLNSCGCKHWMKNPMPTNIDLAEIDAILGFEKESDSESQIELHSNNKKHCLELCCR